MNQNSAQNQKRKEDESNAAQNQKKKRRLIKIQLKISKEKKINQNSAQNQKRKEDESKFSSALLTSSRPWDS